MKSFISILSLGLFLVVSKVAAQASQLCQNINLYTACMTASRQRIDGCGAKLAGVPTIEFYECQCTELKSISNCFTYCPDDLQIQGQLASENANSKTWCEKSEQMRSEQNAKNEIAKSAEALKPTSTTPASSSSVTMNVPISSTGTVSTGSSSSNSTNSGSTGTSPSSKRPQATSNINFSSATTFPSDIHFHIVIVVINFLSFLF